MQVTGPARERLKTERQCDTGGGAVRRWRCFAHVAPCRPELATDLKAMMAAMNDVWEQDRLSVTAFGWSRVDFLHTLTVTAPEVPQEEKDRMEAELPGLDMLWCRARFCHTHRNGGKEHTGFA